MTKTNQNFHRWYPWPKMTKKKQKLSLLVSLTKNDQDQPKFSPLVSLAEKAKKEKKIDRW